MKTSIAQRFALWTRGPGIILCLLCASSAFSVNVVRAQTGSVAGRIIDAASGDPLPGAAIMIAGTAIGSATNLEGDYVISRVPAGEQPFRVTYIGYETLDLTIEVVEGETVTEDIALSPAIVQGEEVVIYSQAEGQARAIQQQLASNTIVNVVSAARIQELPDANAAESVGRLPGVSIVRDAGEGAKVTVRGLAPKYSSITVDGNKVPSTDLDDRSVDLNMISPEMLAGIEVYKSLRPDMDADAVGGTINFRTSGAPERRRFNVSFLSGYHDQVSKVGSYKASGSGSDRFFNDRLGAIATLSFHRADRSSDVMSSGYEVLRDAREGEAHAPIGIRNLRLNDRDETRDRYGLGLNLDYQLPNGRIYFSNFANRLDRDELQWERVYNISSMRQEWELTDRDIQVDVLSSRLSGEHRLLGTQVDWRLARSISNRSHPYQYAIDFFEVSGLVDSQIDETAGPTKIPEAARNNLDETALWQSHFSKVRSLERDLTAQLDWTIPARLGTRLAGDFKFGGKHYSKHRDRTGSEEWELERWEMEPVWRAVPDRPWTFTSTGYLNIRNWLDTGYDNGGFLDGQYDMSLGVDRDALAQIWSQHASEHEQDFGVVFDDHEATERISAFYGMTEWHLGRRIMFMPGIRYEYENSEYHAKSGSPPSEDDEEQLSIRDTTAVRKTGDWFPMLHLRVRLTDWFDVRLARTRSASRPDFGMVAPQESINYNGGSVRRGDTHLDPALATNYDAFLSFHGNRLGLFTIGLFHKKIDGLLYYRDAVVLFPDELDLPSTTRGYQIREPVNNPNETTVRGYELEWQSNLTFLPRPFNGLVINANYSRIESETHYPNFLLRRVPGQGFVGVDTFRVAPMILQPDHVANLAIGYDLGNFSGRISMLYQGPTLRSITARPETDSYTRDYLRWDASVKYNVTRDLRVIVNIQNLTNEPDLREQFSERFPTNMEFYGWTMDLGLGYRF